VLDEKLGPLIKKFEPEVVGVSAGFDSMKGDPLASLNLTDESYLHLYEMIKEFPVFFVLEGGYYPENVEHGVKLALNFF
jgi:acetoin utilization deacetylase AcuC-like enzyme